MNRNESIRRHIMTGDDAASTTDDAYYKLADHIFQNDPEFGSTYRHADSDP